ncbi:MAG: MFS transporter [Bryobacteraceae bacterium]
MTRLAEFLALRRDLALVLAAIVVIGAGEETWIRFVPKYLESLGASVAIIGLYDALKTVLGAVYAYPGGILSDRWGHRRALVFFTALSIAGYIIVLLVPHWMAVLAGMFLFLVWSNLSLAALFSLVGATLAPGKLTMGIGVQSLVKRLPIVVGPIAGGVLIDRFGMVEGVRIGLAISIALGAVSLWIQARMAVEPPDAPKVGSSLGAVVRQFDPRLKRLLWSDILIRFCERIPFAWAVIYAMNNVGASATGVGVLTAVEMTVAMVCYIPVAHFADRHGREPFVLLTFVFFTLFPLSLAVADSFALLMVAFAVRGLKEFGDPARKALIIQYCRPETRGQMIGAYYLIRDTVVATGSFAGAALWAISPRANFLVAAALGAAGTVVYFVSRPRSN